MEFYEAILMKDDEEENTVIKDVFLEGYYSSKQSQLYSARVCTQKRRLIRKNDINSQFIFTSLRKLETSSSLVKRKTRSFSLCI